MHMVTWNQAHMPVPRKKQMLSDRDRTTKARSDLDSQKLYSASVTDYL